MAPGALGDITNSPSKPNDAKFKKCDTLLRESNQPCADDFRADLITAVARSTTVPQHFKLAHAFALNGSPVPIMSLEDSQDIDLPFQANEAKSLIAESDFATKKDGVHYWDAEHVHFSDQSWYEQLKAALLPGATEKLGVLADVHGPFDIKLDQFLIATPGCRIEKAAIDITKSDDQRFATALVLLPFEQPLEGASSLPSTFRTFCGPQNLAYDLHPCLPSSTLALCWYSDANCVIQLGNGYRAGFLYSITCSSATPPQFSDVARAFKRLGELLGRWSDSSSYGDTNKLVVLPLSEKYPTERILTSGHACFTGSDHVLADYLFKISKQYNFQIGLGTLNPLSPPPLATQKRKNESDIVAVLESAVSFTGAPAIRRPLRLSATEVATSSDCIENDLPRSAIVMFPSKYETFVMLRAHGIEYAIERLHKIDTSRPSNEATFLVNLLAHNPTTLPLCGNLLRALAIKWNDATAWYATINYHDPNGNERLLDALFYFSFESLKAIFKDYIIKAPLSSSLFFLHVLPQRVLDLESHTVSAWARENVVPMLRVPRLPQLQDVPTVLQIAETYGYSVVQNDFAPSVKESSGAFSFWMYVLRALHNNGPVTANSENQSTQAKEFQALCEHCLLSAANVIRITDSQPNSVEVQEEVINRAIEFMVECADRRFPAMFPVVMRNLLPQPSAPPAELAADYGNLYIPLIPRVLQFLVKMKWDPFTGTFGAWFHYLIGTYMQKVFGPAPAETIEAPTLSCELQDEDCLSLDHFIKRWDMRRTTFHIPNNRRRHLIVVMQQVPTLLSWETHKIGLPHQLEVTKSPRFAEYQAWCQKRKAAGDFLRIFGYHFLVQLLGEDQIRKFTKALEVDGCFLWTEGQVEAPLPRLPGSITSSLASPFSLSNCVSSSGDRDQATLLGNAPL